MAPLPETDRAALHRNTVRTVSVGTLWRLFRYPFVLLSVTLIPRLMGDTDYGRYVYYMSVFLILDLLTDFGFIQMFGRFLPEGDSDLGDRSSRALIEGSLIYGTLLPLGAWLLFGLAGWIHPAWTLFSPLHFLLLGLTLVFNRLAGTLFLILYGRNQIARFSLREVVRSALTFLLVWALFRSFGLTGALIGLLLNEMALTALGLYWARPWVFRRWTAIRPADFAPFLLFGLAFYLPAFLYGLMQRAGNILVQHLTQSSEQVAYYDVANQFLLLTATFLGLILSTLIPALGALHARGDHDSIARWQGRVAAYCAIALILSAYALLGFGRTAIGLCLGPEFLPVYPNALIIFLATPAILVATVGMNYALLDKKPAAFLQAVTAGAAVMAAGSWILIPAGRSAGAAGATVLGYAALAGVFIVHYHRPFRIIFPPFIRVLLLGLPPAALFLLPALRPHAAPVSLAAGLLFLLLLIGTRTWHPAELRKWIRNVQPPDPE